MFTLSHRRNENTLRSYPFIHPPTVEVGGSPYQIPHDVISGFRAAGHLRGNVFMQSIEITSSSVSAVFQVGSLSFNAVVSADAALPARVYVLSGPYSVIVEFSEGVKTLVDNVALHNQVFAVDDGQLEPCCVTWFGRHILRSLTIGDVVKGTDTVELLDGQQIEYAVTGAGEPELVVSARPAAGLGKICGARLPVEKCGDGIRKICGVPVGDDGAFFIEAGAGVVVSSSDNEVVISSVINPQKPRCPDSGG